LYFTLSDGKNPQIVSVFLERIKKGRIVIHDPQDRVWDKDMSRGLSDGI
jgi:hypothetical protein